MSQTTPRRQICKKLKTNFKEFSIKSPIEEFFNSESDSDIDFKLTENDIIFIDASFNDSLAINLDSSDDSDSDYENIFQKETGRLGDLSTLLSNRTLSSRNNVGMVSNRSNCDVGEIKAMLQRVLSPPQDAKITFEDLENEEKEISKSNNLSKCQQTDFDENLQILDKKIDEISIEFTKIIEEKDDLNKELILENDLLRADNESLHALLGDNYDTMDHLRDMLDAVDQKLNHEKLLKNSYFQEKQKLETLVKSLKLAILNKEHANEQINFQKEFEDNIERIEKLNFGVTV